MKNTYSITQAGAALLALVAFTVLSPMAKATPLGPTLTAVSPTVSVQSGSVATGGTLLNAFGPSTGGSPSFTGTLSSTVVVRSAASIIDGQFFNAGGLDFYYQLTLTSGGSTDIERFNFSPVPIGFGGPLYSAEALVTPVVPGGIAGFSGTANGTQVPTGGRFDGGTISFDFVGTVNNRLTAANPQSVFIVLHTNAVQFATLESSIQDGGVATSRVLAPVPEPTTALFGIAMIGAVAVARRRSGSKAITA